MVKVLHSEVGKKPNNKLTITVVLILILLASGVFYYIYDYAQNYNKKNVVNAYITALKNSDANALESLVPPEFDATEAIKNDLREFGGKDIKILNKSYRNWGDSSTTIEVTITGLKNSKPFEKQITIEGQGEAWYLLMGKMKPEYLIPESSLSTDKDSSNLSAEDKKLIEDCGINTCCLSSAKVIINDTNKDYLKPSANCPAEKKENRLTCKGSYSWCEIKN